MTREEDEEDDDLGLVTVPLKPKLGMNLCNRLQFKVIGPPWVVPSWESDDLWGC